MKTLELTITDRLWLLHNLPEKGNRVAMMLIKNLLERLEFSPDEISLYELKEVSEGRYKFNSQAEQRIGITVSAEQLAILSGCIDEADRRELITLDVLNLAAKIDVLLEKETE